MSDNSRTPSKIILEWWKVIVVFLGIVGGYIWLDETFAKVKRLEAERDVLVQRIETQKADFESKLQGQKEEFEVALRAKDCELQYTIAIEQTTHDVEADQILIEEQQAFLPNPEDPTEKAVEERQVRKGTIQSYQDRRIARLKSLQCLTEARGNCDAVTKVDTDRCHYLLFYR